jgi:hypothetical protein
MLLSDPDANNGNQSCAIFKPPYNEHVRTLVDLSVSTPSEVGTVATMISFKISIIRTRSD